MNSRSLPAEEMRLQLTRLTIPKHPTLVSGSVKDQAHSATRLSPSLESRARYARHQLLRDELLLSKFHLGFRFEYYSLFPSSFR